MSNVSRSWSGQELIASALRTFEIKSADRERALLLFTDYLHLVLSGKKELTSNLSNEPLSNIAFFAKACSYSDLDDVNWKQLTHPGSIIFSALLPLVWEIPLLHPLVDGPQIRGVICGSDCLSIAQMHCRGSSMLKPLPAQGGQHRPGKNNGPRPLRCFLKKRCTLEHACSIR